MTTTGTESELSGREGRQSRPGARSTTIVVLALSLLLALLVGLGVVMVERDYRATVGRAELTVLSAAQTTSEYARWIFESSQLVLDRFDALLGDNPSVFSRADIGELDQALAALPGDPSVWISNSFGTTVLSTDRERTPQNIATRDYFLALQMGTSWMPSRFLVEGEEKVFAVARRIEREGEFLGVVGLMMPVSQLSEFWATLGLGAESTVALIRDDGWLIARHPIPDEAVNIGNYDLFQTYLAEEPSGTFRSEDSPIDGEARIVGYADVPDLPLIATVSVAVDEAMAPFWQRFRLILGIGVPIGLALVGIAIWGIMLLRRDALRRRQLSEALARNRTLLADTHHRVRNNLQLITSMVNLHPAPAETKKELVRRIAAVASFHRQLYQSGEYGSVDLASYLIRTIDALNQGYGDIARIEYRIEPIRVDVRIALPLALISSEVASNALKHAFTPGTEGLIIVGASKEGQEIELTISDNGKGMEGEPEGFGTTLIKALTEQLGATYAFERREGTAFRLRMTVDEIDTEPLEVDDTATVGSAP